MPGPSANDLHVDQLLSDLAVQFSPQEFIADEVAPLKTVNKRSDKFPTYTKRDRYVVPDDAIGPTTEANLVRWSTGTDSFKVEDHALADYVAKDEIDNADDPFTPLSDAQEIILAQLMLGREKRVSDLVMNAAAYAAGNKVTLTYGWDDYTNGDPIGDIHTGLETINEGSPSDYILVISLRGWNKLRQHPDILSAVGKYSGAGGKGLATREEVAAALEIRKVVVGRTRYDTANPAQTMSLSLVWPTNQALLARVPSAPKAKDVMLARTFRYKPAGESEIQTATEQVRRRGVRGSTWISTSFSDDEKIISADVGYHFTGVAA